MTSDLRTFIQGIFGEEFGLLPTNTSIKPVHVANGLGRALVGRAYKSDELTHFLRRTILNQRTRVQDERNPSHEILRLYPKAFVGRDGPVPDSNALSTLRTLAEGVLATDKAVFGEAAVSSYTLSNEMFLTRDPSDNHSGAFLGQLLLAAGEGDAAAHIRELLSSEDDPWSTLALPMTRLAQPVDLTRSSSAGGEPLGHGLLRVDAHGQTLASPSLAKLREALDRLARFERRRGAKLNSLRRIVTLSCFAIHVHLVARYSEAVDGAPRPPILVDMFDGTRTSLRNASRASLRAAGDVLESLVTHRIQARIDSLIEVDGAEQIIHDLAANSPPRKEIRQRLQQGFEAYRHDVGVSDVEALSEAIWQVGTEELNHPVEFLTELGRRAGYLTPWANSGRGGKLQKRYGITTEFLETLVAATVEPDRPLTFPEFLDALRADYGIIVGQRSDDHIVRCNNLAEKPFGTPTSVAEEDLRLNLEALRRAIVEAGYAKAYADGQTVITTEPESLIAQ